MLRLIIKVPAVLFALLLYFVVALPFFPLLIIFPFWTRRLLLKIIRFFCRILLFVLCIDVTVLGEEIINKDESYFVVSNHLSYLDVLIYFSYFPSCFITSTDIKRTPFLGQVCSLAGCLFVNRRSRKTLHNEIRNIIKLLDHGLRTFVFPEATSGDGSGLLPFKRALFEAAKGTKAKILPLTINYRALNGEKVTVQNRDRIFWYGDMTFFPHLLGFLMLRSCSVEINVESPIDSKLESIELAKNTQDIIHKSFIPISCN